MRNLDELKFSLSVAWDDPWYRWQTIFTLVLALIGSGFFLWHVIPEGLQSGLLVLHYNPYVGIDEVQFWPWIITLPLALLVVVLADVLVAGFLFRHDRLASRVLLCMSSAFTAIGLVGAVFLMLVNL
jgi:hypothetical protein